MANELNASKINPKLVGESGKESESAMSHITYAWNAQTDAVQVAAARERRRRLARCRCWASSFVVEWVSSVTSRLLSSQVPVST